jgi:hypothetical protein
MTDTNKSVEAINETAETHTDGVTVNTPEVDYAAIIEAKDAELAKLAEEKENYRKGLLKAKGKLPVDDYSVDNVDETEDEKINRIVDQRLLQTKESQLKAEKDLALTNIIKRNKELEIALKNRQQISAISTGSNSEKVQSDIKTDNFFSPEQIQALKAKGYDDKKIEALKANVKKQAGIPQVV